MTRPPPFLEHSAMARAMAAVLSVLPSPTAPNFFISKSRLGNAGAVMRARIPGTSAQAASSFANADIKEPEAAAAALRRRNSRLSVMLAPKCFLARKRFCDLRGSDRADDVGAHEALYIRVDFSASHVTAI